MMEWLLAGALVLNAIMLISLPHLWLLWPRDREQGR